MTNDQILQLIGAKEVQIAQLQLHNQQLQVELNKHQVDTNEADHTEDLGE